MTAPATAAEATAFPRSPVGLALLALTLLPLVFKALFFASTANIFGYGLATLGFGLGLASLSRGQTTEAARRNAPFASPAKLPYKLIGAGLMGLTAAGLTLFKGGFLGQAFGSLFVVTALTAIAFGIDPLRKTAPESTESRRARLRYELDLKTKDNRERLRRALAPLNDDALHNGQLAFSGSVDRLLDALASNPSSLRSARKHLSVYLKAAADAAERFAGVYSVTRDTGAHARFIQLLADLTDRYTSAANACANAGHSELDVEISVLNAYLNAENTVA